MEKGTVVAPAFTAFLSTPERGARTAIPAGCGRNVSLLLELRTINDAGRTNEPTNQKDMTLQATIRSETDADADAIAEVTKSAFETLEISDQTEPFIVEALRKAGALSVSLVAEVDGRVVGHIAFSPVEISDGTPGWYGLGPMSVLPEYQRRGIGKALIEAGLARLQSMGARGCCLVGHPDYYPKFGFENASGLVFEGVPPEAFFAISFGEILPRGRVAFHEAFTADGT